MELTENNLFALPVAATSGRGKQHLVVEYLLSDRLPLFAEAFTGGPLPQARKC